MKQDCIVSCDLIQISVSLQHNLNFNTVYTWYTSGVVVA